MKTNAQLYDDVMAKLTFEPMIHADKMTIAVHEGVVTLAGSVGNLFEKRAAEKAVKSLQGVKAVANDLVVNILAPYQRSDADIAKAAVNALAWDIVVPQDNIQVTVSEGRVTLTGKVDYGYQRESAEKAIRRLAGVKSINNQIEIAKRLVDVKDIKRKIMQEFERHAAIDANNVHVDMAGNTVTLTGKVCSWAEYKEAERIAWAAPGVSLVNNQLDIIYNI